MAALRFFLLCILLTLSGAQDGSDAPVFHPLSSSDGVTFKVYEGAARGTGVGTVQALGLPQETVVYRLQEDEEEEERVFEIGSSSGEITVGPNGTDNLVIKNGVARTITFQVYAYYESAGPSGNRSNLSVMVEVEDVNSSPYFDNVETELSVIEGIEVGSVVQRFTATDDDLGLNAALQYSLVEVHPNGDTDDFFSIQQYTADVSVARSLSLSSTYELIITASDEGSPALSVSLNISIRVDPVPPTFDELVYEADLLEFTDQTGVAVVTVSATALSGESVSYSVLSWTPAPEGLNFTAGSSTGLVEAAGTLDRETFSRYIVTVTAYEHPDVSTNSEATVVVHVSDVNEPPEFLRSHYSVAISEGAGPGDVLYSDVEALDQDEGSNAILTYSIANISALTTEDGVREAISEPFFTIDSATAELYVNTDLEREAEVDGYHYYEITVVASDGGTPSLSTSTLVTVTVTDVNDNPPMFSSSLYTLTIPESAGEGGVVGTVQVSDRDEGDAANISFSLSGSGSNRFRIAVLSVTYPSSVQSRPPTVTRGRIYTTEQLDREEVSHYELTVLAQDTTDQPLSGTAQVTITVLDSNDNVPTFVKDTFNFEVEEETLLSDFAGAIGEISATDADEGSNALIDFSLAVSAAESEIFSLQASNSTVTLLLQRSLDRETTDFFSLRLLATDRGSPALVGEARINITVQDVNDHVPVFSEDPYELNVTEDSEVGSVLLTVAATDADIGENAALSFSVEGSSVVTVEAGTGEMVLAAMLDYEINTRLEVEIIAVDSGSPQQTGTATVVLNIVDINDNPPLFSKSTYSVMVHENVTTGAELIRVVASDADSGERGTVTFSLSGPQNGPFSIDASSGAVTVATNLDREQREEYEFSVTAEDMGTPSMNSTVSLYITVLDVNDNAPQFQQASYTAEVSEGISTNSSLGELVIQVTATDADAGSNGEIAYRLSGSEVERFAIDSATGEVTVAIPLDYETVTEPYVLTVIAEDSGNNPMSAAVTLQITVTDGNDHAPAFLGLPYIVRLEEGTSGPLVVLFARATDLDEGSNGEVEFLLIGGEGLFGTNRAGNVSLLAGREVDREGSGVEAGEGEENVIALTLTAVDSGSPIQLSQTIVTVLISDINDNSPQFQQSSYSVQVSEALTLSSEILNILATDADYGSNAEVVYVIESHQPDLGTFSIDSQTGTLSLSSSLDREAHPLFYLTVSATDQGTPSLNATVAVVVNVTDVNDNHPVFSIPVGGYLASLVENTTVGSDVITVVATDRDSGLHSQITYSLGDPSVPFQIQDPETGRITVSESLDRELTAQYSLIVIAMDMVNGSATALQTEAVVTIVILDINDNAPQFVSATYQGSVSEGLPAGTTVTLFPDLVATDADTSPNGEVTYSLTGGDAQFFILDPLTAGLTTQQTFDAEETQTFADLQVVATDNGGLSSTVPLTVFIGDQNDFSPFFTIAVGTNMTVSEALQPGAVVIIVTAMDRDVQGNTLNFSLGGIQEQSSNASGNPFVIDPLTGAISVGEGGLDFERSFYYVLTVVVQDSGVPARSNSTQVLILLTDVNDNPPEFTPPSQPFSVEENSPIGTTVGSLAVSDADSPQLTELRYLIVEGNEGGRFTVDPITCSISTSGLIDREVREIYNLIIEARDAPQFFLVGTGTAVITIGDVNDRTPSFTTPTMIGMMEEMSIGTLVTEFSAMDRDDGENGTLTYRILSSSPEEHFTINSTTGEVFTSTVVDRETIDTYTLVIEANDGGTPSLTSTGTLVIEILDINDNSPQFVGSSEATIIENPLDGSVVSTNLTATDQDEGSNAELTWRILSGNVFDTFRIDAITGMILVQNATELDYETTPTFFLQLSVEDDGEPSRSNELLLRVNLLDDNDHAPMVSPVAPLTLPEDSPVGGIIAVVTATDDDEGINADLSFFVLSGNIGGVFSILSDGTLRIVSDLDYEAVTRYDLVVEVQDGGVPPMIDSTTVVIIVTDINDNAPSFINLPTTIQIREDTVDPTITTLQIQDQDSGDNGEFELTVVSVNGGDPAPFSLFFVVLRAEGSLDYEEQSQYIVILEAIDRGNPSLTTQAEVTVNVRDIDDNPPTFQEPPHYIISEAQPILTPFAILQTEDLDTPANSNAYYYITGGTTVQFFDVISETGQLFLSQLVDRESVAVHTVEITAQSFQGDSAACTAISCSVTDMIVTLLDVNDNAPQWILNEFIIGVNETAVLNDTIGMIEARDPDAEDFGLVWYRLSDPSTPLVVLEEQTGVLKLTQTLGELQSRVAPVFTAAAYDNRGQDPSMTSTNVAVRVVFVGPDHLVVITTSKPLTEVLEDSSEIYRAVEMVPGVSLSVYDIREHTAVDDGVEKRQASETDVIVFGLNSETSALFTSQETLEVLSINMSIIDDILSVSGITVFPSPTSDSEDGGISTLTLTIVVAAVVIGVLIVVLLVTICGCCWLQNRLKQKRKRYAPGSSTYQEPRESVRYSTAEGVEFWDETEQRVGGWDKRSYPTRAPMRGKKGRRRKADSGAQPWDSRDSEEVRQSVLYESKDFVMDCFEDSDGDETEEGDVEIKPASNFRALASQERDDHESMELQDRSRSGHRDTGEGASGSEGESEGEEDDTLPMVRPQSNLATVEEGEEGEEQEEWEEGGEGAWEDGEEGERGAWEEGEEDELSPADMMTEEEAMMLAAPLEEDTPPNPLLY